MIDPLVSTEEAAKILDVSVSTLKNWRTRKIFGCYFFTADEKHGNTWYYYRERVEQLKSVYQFGILQNIYKLARRNPEPTPPDDFQKSDSSRTLGVVTPSSTTSKSLPTDLFVTEQVANTFGISESILKKWNAEKKLQPFIIDHNGKFWYSREQLTQLKSATGRQLPVGQSLNDFFNNPANNIIRKLNVQIYPSKTIYFPNDRFSKKITTFTKDNFKNMNEGEALKLVELKNHKKFGKIVSPFRIYVDENSSFTLSEPINQFDFAILCACVSEYHIDNHYTTPAIIHRALTGKVNKGSEAEPSKDQLANIMNSIEKLMFLKSKINMTDYCQKLKCNDGNAFEILSPLLPCKIITETTINGKASIVIQFTDVSPFWQIASLKNQFLSFDAELLDVPHQQNTKMNIELKNYSIHRIVEIKAHNLTPTLTFDDIFFKCRIENTNADKKRDARNVLTKFFKHLQAKNFIKSFELTKKGNPFYSIKFTYSKK